MKKLLIALFLFPVTLVVAVPSAKPRLGEAPVRKIVAAMSLEEKAGLLVGTSMEGYAGEGAVTGRTLKTVPGSAGTTRSLESYGIPTTVMADGPAGLRIDPERAGDARTYFCTAFPIGTMLASTWDEAAIERCGAAMGNEVLEYGCDVILGPGMNIHRHPLCGRNFEYYSEDPLLSGKCGAAMVRGIQSQGVGTSVKHFAANNQESMRLQNDARVSQRALREIYLRGFEIAVKEGRPWTVMSSYNRINGPYTQESRELLTTVLHDEWGYEGLVVSDWIGKRNTVAQVHAGNDLMMPGEPAQGYSSGQVLEAIGETAREVLPSNYTYEFGGISREESKTTNNATLIFLLCMVLVYLILCALYESVFIPFAVLLSVPCGLMGSFLFAWLFGLENNIYMQTGLIMIIGLLAKTAILLTEYAGKRRSEGMTLAQAAYSAAKVRLRPILMTVLSMVFGLVPLMMAHGVGANGSRSLATGVIGGMIVGTLALLFLVPSLFIVFQYIQERVKHN